MASNKQGIFVGDRFEANEGGFATVIKYNGTRDVEIVFDDTKTTLRGVSTWRLRNGCIKDVNRVSVYGVGFVGVGNYQTCINYKQTPEYKKWTGMLSRCYASPRRPAYVGVTVHPMWHSFQTFAGWYCSYQNIKILQSNNQFPIELDKDLLGCGSVYSLENCVLLPKQINMALRFSVAGGARKKWNRYEVQVGKNSVHTSYGTYSTRREAEQVYAFEKSQYVKELAIQYKEVLEDRAFDALMNWKPKQEMLLH